MTIIHPIWDTQNVLQQSDHATEHTACMRRHYSTWNTRLIRRRYLVMRYIRWLEDLICWSHCDTCKLIYVLGKQLGVLRRQPLRLQSTFTNATKKLNKNLVNLSFSFLLLFSETNRKFTWYHVGFCACSCFSCLWINGCIPAIRADTLRFGVEYGLGP